MSRSPYVVGIVFLGRPTPDVVTIDGEHLIEDPNWGQAWTSPPIDLEEGLNELRLVVEANGEVVEDAVLAVTYVKGADEALGWIVAADADSITVDFTDWDDDREFPGPDDPDPDVLVRVPVAEDVRVIVNEEIEVDYPWLVDEVAAGWSNSEGIEGMDDWNPNGVYPFVLTVHDGDVVQIWKVPLG